MAYVQQKTIEGCWKNTLIVRLIFDIWADSNGVIVMGLRQLFWCVPKWSRHRIGFPL